MPLKIGAGLGLPESSGRAEHDHDPSTAGQTASTDSAGARVYESPTDESTAVHGAPPTVTRPHHADPVSAVQPTGRKARSTAQNKAETPDKAENKAVSGDAAKSKRKSR